MLIVIAIMVAKDTYVFADNLLQCMTQNFPGEHLDILLDVPGFRCGKAHDNLEEVLAVGLGLGNGERAETLEISPDSIFLLDGEAYPDQGLEQIDGIHTCNKAFLLPTPVYATDANAIRYPILRRNGSEVSMDGTTALYPSEMDQATLRIAFLSAPILSHRI